jgi:hypothetical protein
MAVVLSCQFANTILYGRAGFDLLHHRVFQTT